MQLSGSVNTTIVGNAAAGISIINPVDANWAINVYGTPVDTAPQPFPTIPSQLPGYSRSLLNGGAKNYLLASYLETPIHREIQFATQDISSVQLQIRPVLTPAVLAQWQMANAQLGDTRGV